MSAQILISTTSDGSMLHVPNEEAIRANRERFLAAHGITMDDAIRMQIVYKGEDYCRYQTIGRAQAGAGMIDSEPVYVDAMFTREKGVALFLPLADCIGAVIEDRAHGVLGLAHLGRHSLEQYGGQRTIEYMTREFGSLATDIFVTLSPSAGKENYPVLSMQGRGLQELAVEQFGNAGVQLGQIVQSSVDTTRDERYFSHSEFLAGHRETDGRFAILTVQ